MTEPAFDMTLELESCTLIVRIFNRRDARHVDWSYAVLISKLTGDVLRMRIPELITALERAATWMRKAKR